LQWIWRDVEAVGWAIVISRRKRDRRSLRRGDHNIHIFFKDSLDSVHVAAFQKEEDYYIKIVKSVDYLRGKRLVN